MDPRLSRFFPRPRHSESTTNQSLAIIQLSLRIPDSCRCPPWAHFTTLRIILTNTHDPPVPHPPYPDTYISTQPSLPPQSLSSTNLFLLLYHKVKLDRSIAKLTNKNKLATTPTFNRHHGHRSSAVQDHVSFLEEDLPSDSPLPLCHQRPNSQLPCLSGWRLHVQPPDDCPPMPRYGISHGRPEREDRQCRVWRHCCSQGHPRLLRQGQHWQGEASYQQHL